MNTCPKCGADEYTSTSAEREWKCGSFVPRGMVRVQQSDACRIAELEAMLAGATAQLREGFGNLRRELDEVTAERDECKPLLLQRFTANELPEWLKREIGAAPYCDDTGDDGFPTIDSAREAADATE